MKANELRIGNYVNLFGLTATVQADDFNMTEHGIAIEQGKPILLTEEWLERFGKIQWLYKDIDEYFVWFNGDKIYIKFVHTLQNLYFALTGEELKIIQK